MSVDVLCGMRGGMWCLSWVVGVSAVPTSCLAMAGLAASLPPYIQERPNPPPFPPNTSPLAKGTPLLTGLGEGKCKSRVKGTDACNSLDAPPFVLSLIIAG